MRVVITGAAGNIGISLIRYCAKYADANNIVAAVRNIDKARKQLSAFNFLHFTHFDFEDPSTYAEAFKGADKSKVIPHNKKKIFIRETEFSFFIQKRKEGVNPRMIAVMIMLHVLPRFQKEPEISDFFEKLTGKRPTSVKEFINRDIVYFT